MKSPWRLLADLTSRRKPDPAPLQLPAPAQENIVEDDKRDLENSPVASVATIMPLGAGKETADAVPTTVEQPLPAAVESIKGPGETKPKTSPEIPGDAEPLAASLADVETPLAAETEPKRPVDAAPLETGVKPAKRVKPAKGRTTAPPTLAAADETKEHLPAAQPLSFSDEASAVDAEITELKLALAEKLKQQNAQLKKMLARFNVG